MRGFKATNSDMTCIGYQYELGKTFEMPESDVSLCRKGFHYCPNLVGVFNYYGIGNGNRFFEVEAAENYNDVLYYGTIQNDKYATHKITFVRELTDDEIYKGFDAWLKFMHTTVTLGIYINDSDIITKEVFDILRDIRYEKYIGDHKQVYADTILGLLASDRIIYIPDCLQVKRIKNTVTNLTYIINRLKEWYMYKYGKVPAKFDIFKYL